MIRRLCCLAVFAVVVGTVMPARAQPPITAHQHAMTVATNGGVILLAARIRSYLGIINDSSNVVYCKVDGTDAASGDGWRLTAAGSAHSQIVFEVTVPQGALRCFASSSSAIQVIEGR